jgi:hypothetical protein
MKHLLLLLLLMNLWLAACTGLTQAPGGGLSLGGQSATPQAAQSPGFWHTYTRVVRIF